MARHLQFIFMKIILDSSIIAMKHNAVAQQRFLVSRLILNQRKQRERKRIKFFFKKKEHLEFESVLLLTKSTHLVTGIATDAILMTAVLRTLL